MINYNISPALNKNKVFLINLSELLGRLDPAYNIAIRNSDLRTKYPTEQIGKLVKSFSGGTPSKANPEFWKGNILWASPKDFKDFYLTDTEDRISESALSNSSTTLAPVNSLLIVVRSGVLIHTIPVAIAKLPMAINQDLKALIPDDRILPEYLGIYFRIYNDKLLPLIVKHSTTVQSINTEQFEKLKIPIPPKNIQQQIIAIYGKALQIKKQTEAEAEKLLASIDDYLLKELGITLPAPSENNLKNRMYTISISDLAGRRFDPFYNNPLYSLIDKEIKKSIHLLRKFSDVFYAVRGVTFSGADVVDNGLRVLRANNIDLKSNQLIFEDIMNVSDQVEFNDSQKLYREDILMSAASGSKAHVGKVAFIENDLEYYFGAFMMVLKRVDFKNDPKYLFEYLQSKIFRAYLFRLLGGTNINNLNFEMIRNLYIPLPEPHKQKEIANHITGIRQQAQQLKEKTKEALSKASQEIEKILLA